MIEEVVSWQEIHFAKYAKISETKSTLCVNRSTIPVHVVQTFSVEAEAALPWFCGRSHLLRGSWRRLANLSQRSPFRGVMNLMMNEEKRSMCETVEINDKAISTEKTYSYLDKNFLFFSNFDLSQIEIHLEIDPPLCTRWWTVRRAFGTGSQPAATTASLERTEGHSDLEQPIPWILLQVSLRDNFTVDVFGALAWELFFDRHLGADCLFGSNSTFWNYLISNDDKKLEMIFQHQLSRRLLL